MKNLKKAVRWELKEVGNERSIQLFDGSGNKLRGEESYWEGDFYCSYNQLTTLQGAPKEVGGSFYCHYNQLTTLQDSPKIVGGSFNCSYNRLTTLQGAPKEVGGGFYCSRNQLTTLQGSPKEVGGAFDCSYNQLTISECRPLKLTLESALKKGYVFADGVLTKLISRKIKGNKEIFLTRKIGSKKKVWVVKEGNKFSHGETLKLALEDLIYKTTLRDTSEFKSWSISKKVTLEEAISCYRSITGACFEGVKNFVKQSEIPKELTIESIIKLTEGKYGNREFKEFFNESNN